jgi:hypothetical protein
VPKNIKDGTKPAQKRFSLVASKMPFPAKTKPSNHFLQLIYKNYNTNNYNCGCSVFCFSLCWKNRTRVKYYDIKILKNQY